MICWTNPVRLGSPSTDCWLPVFFEKWTWSYRKERYHIWYVDGDGNTDRGAGQLADGQIETAHAFALAFATLTKAAICSHLRSCGTVISYSEENVELLVSKHMKFWIKEVTIEISERENDSLLHRLNIAGCNVPWPPPLCLKCGEVEHVSGKCPYRRPVTTTQDSPHLPPHKEL